PAPGAPRLDPPAVGVAWAQVHHPAHPVARHVGVIDQLDPELRQTAQVLDAQALHQRLAYLSTVSLRLPRDDQATQAQAAPDEGHHEQARKDEEDLLQDVPAAQLRKYQDNDDEDG